MKKILNEDENPAKMILPASIDESFSSRLANIGFVCACLVVSLHVPLATRAGSALYYCHVLFRDFANVSVSVFFMMSGYLLAGHINEPGWWLAAVKKRAKSLAMPYLFWNAWFLLVTSVINWSSNGDSTWSGWIHFLGLNPFSGMQLSHLWFIRCLLVMALFSSVLSVILMSRVRIVVMVGLFSGMWLIRVLLPSDMNFVTVFYIYSWFQGIAFFSLGYCWRITKVKGQLGYLFRMLLLLLGLVLFVSSRLMPTTELLFRNLMQTLGTFSTVLWFWYAIPSFRWPKWLTSCSMAVYCMHSTWLYLLVQWESNNECVYIWLLKWALAVSASILITRLLNLIFPSISRMAFGGRTLS